jgi:hypothetical protein
MLATTRATNACLNALMIICNIIGIQGFMNKGTEGSQACTGAAAYLASPTHYSVHCPCSTHPASVRRYLAANDTWEWAFYLAGGLKIVYDLLLLTWAHCSGSMVADHEKPLPAPVHVHVHGSTQTPAAAAAAAAGMSQPPPLPLNNGGPAKEQA